jgi:hypothetical protein
LHVTGDRSGRRRAAATLRIGILIWIGAAGGAASLAHADDITVRQRVQAGIPAARTSLRTLHHALNRFDAFERGTRLDAAAVPRARVLARTVEDGAVASANVVRAYVIELANPDVAADATDASTAQGVNLLRGGLALEQRGLTSIGDAYRGLLGEIYRLTSGDRAAAKRDLDGVLRATVRTESLLTRAARFGVKARALLAVNVSGLFLS